MIVSCDFLLSACIFIFSKDIIIKVFEAHAPDILEIARSALDASKQTQILYAWVKKSDLKFQLIDYAIMEENSNPLVMPCESTWSDLG